MADFGGEMNFTVNGSPLIMRAKFESEPVPFETEGGANQDGSIYRTLKPKGYMAKPTFQDTAVGTPTTMDWEGILRGGPYNISLVESQNGRLHTWTGAQFEGKPAVDIHTGEVTGIELRSRGYKRTGA